MTGDCNCNPGATAGDQIAASYLDLASLGAVLGPNLGGGVSGSHIGSGVGRVGGGDTPAVTHFTSPNPIHFPQVRVDIHFDFTTPALIFGGRPDQGLTRQYGGML